VYDLKVILENDKGFKWFQAHGISFKGYLLADGEYLTGSAAADFLKSKFGNFEDPEKDLKELNGVFAMVYEGSGILFACCDRTRSFPLFYRISDNGLTIADKPKAFGSGKDTDDESIKIFLYSGYATGNRTLLKDVFQVQAGEYIIRDKENFERKFYYRFASGNRISDNGVLEKDLTDTLNVIGRDLSISLEGRTAVVPLSSGYDSRLIAVLLKSAGINDAVTFTYGRKDNPEIGLSRKTAQKLGFRWEYIEYDEETVKNYLNTDDFRSYFPFASACTSMFYLQEFFALQKLKEMIPENSVFIPGHSGDTIAGSHLSDDMTGELTKEALIDRIISKHFNMKPVNSKNREFLSEELAGAFEGSIFSGFDYEDWIIKERHGKFVINSNRIYEFFGYEYRMPLVDSRFMDTMSLTPSTLRAGKKLYDSVLKRNFFEKYGLNFSNETNPEPKDIRMQETKNSIKKIMPKKIINFYKEKLRKNTDIYYNIGVTDRMIKDLESYGAPVDKNGENRNSIIIQWYIHQLINGRI